MSARARTAAVLRQPTLADDARVPGRALPVDTVEQRQAERARDRKGMAAGMLDEILSGADTDTDAEPGVTSIDAAAIETEIERRAALAAESIIEQQRAAWVAQAREDGYAAGVQSGREAVEREWAKLAERAQRLLDAVTAQAARETQASVEFAFHLTFASLRKIFGEAFASQAGAQAAIENVLAQTDAQTVVAIRVAPQDVALLGGADQSAGLFGVLPKAVAVEADERVALGGCVLETRRGAIDGRVESQLEGLLDAIRSAYASRSVPRAGEGEAA
jgi:flagellar assembly protein FliH